MNRNPPFPSLHLYIYENTPRTGSGLCLNSDWIGYDPSFGNHQSPDVLAEQIPYDGMPYSAPFSFGPYSALILSQ